MSVAHFVEIVRDARIDDDVAERLPGLGDESIGKPAPLVAPPDVPSTGAAAGPLAVVAWAVS